MYSHIVHCKSNRVSNNVEDRLAHSFYYTLKDSKVLSRSINEIINSKEVLILCQHSVFVRVIWEVGYSPPPLFIMKS